MDDRRRFIEAVLSGVTAAVIGVEHDRRITIANTSAEELLSLKSDELVGKNLAEIAPEVEQVVTEATSRHRNDFRKQISLVRGGTVRTLSVQVTREETRDTNEFLRHHPRRHHRSRHRPAFDRLGRRRPPYRA